MCYNKNTWVNVTEHFLSLMFRKNKLTHLFVELSVLKFVIKHRSCQSITPCSSQF